MINTKAVVLILACTILGFVSGWLIRKRTADPVVSGIQKDTVYVENTVALDSFEVSASIQSQPVLVPREKVKASDSDSTLLEVPAETRTFRDTADNVVVEATVTGVQAYLDKVNVSYLSPLITETKTVVKPYEGWKMSVTSTNALCLDAAFSLNCVEFSYCSGPFQFGLQGGALIDKQFAGNFRVSPYIGGRITIDVLKFN